MSLNNKISNGLKVSFNTKSFQKKDFDQRTILKYLNGAKRDLKIASTNEEPEVIFNFSYSALIKIGISLIAFYKHRVKSRKGHHIKILEKLSEILEDENIEIIGDKMRKKRNFDLYEGGIIIAKKEVNDYLDFVKKVINNATKYLKGQDSLF